MKKFILFFMFTLVAGIGYSQSLQIRILSLMKEEQVDSVRVFLKNMGDNSEVSAWTNSSGVIIFSKLTEGQVYIAYTQGNDT